MITQDGDTAASKLSSKARFFSAVPLSVSINELMVAGIAVRGSYRIGSKSFSLATARNSSASRFVPAIAKLLFVIGVKTATGFSPQVAAHDHALLNRAGAESRILEERAIERLRGGKVDIIADQIHQLERSHAKIAGLLHDSIDGLQRSIAVAEDSQPLVVKRPGDAIDDESRRVLRASRSFTHGAHKRGGLLDDGR